MKKLFIILSFFLIFVPALALAQGDSLTTQIPTAESDYRYQFDQYRARYQAYVTAKQTYESDKTLVAETAALNAAKAVAIARSATLRTYTAWVRLRLLSLISVYPQAAEYADGLNTQIVWYQNHEAAISSTTSLSSFDQVMNDYYFKRTERQKLYSAAQIVLKLAELAGFQHEARGQFDPILTALKDKQNVPEVQQGLIHIAQIGDEINVLITATQTIVGSIQSEDLAAKQALQKASEKLDAIRTKQLELITFITELEQNYYDQ